MDLKIKDLEQKNYALALDISEDRAKELIAGVKEITKNITKEKSITLQAAFQIIDETCSNDNERALCLFKMGQLEGATVFAKMIEREYGIDTGVIDCGY